MTRNNFNEVSLKFHEVSLLLSFMKFRKKWAMKLPNHRWEGYLKRTPRYYIYLNPRTLPTEAIVRSVGTGDEM